MDDPKRAMSTAVVSTFGLMFTLLTLVMVVAERSNAGSGPILELALIVILLVGVLTATSLTIVQWIRCAKTYIDSAIDRKLAIRPDA